MIPERNGQRETKQDSPERDVRPKTVLAVDALLDILEAEGVDCIYGVPGGPLTALFEALQKRPQIRFVLARHEAGAAFMAANHAAVTGSLAVACGTSGPGATNALTGVAMARMNDLPVLFLSGQNATTSFGTGAIQESSVFGTDLVSVFGPVTKLSAQIPAQERFVSSVRHAIRAATTGRPGPVHLNLPANFLSVPIEMKPYSPERARAAGKVLEPGATSVLREMLLKAERPLFLAGHGVRASGAEEELLILARMLGARVVTTPKGKGVVPENDPRFAGILGFGGHEDARRAVEESDVIVVFGSSMGEFVLQGSPLPQAPESKLAQVDIDPERIGRNVDVDLGIVADIRTLLVELVVELAENSSTLGSGLVRVGKRPLRPSTPPAKENSETAESTGAVPPRRVVEALRKALDDRDYLLVDLGTATLWALHHFEVRAARTFFTDLGFACMGTAVAGAVGASVADSSRRTVALVGDGAFAMHGFEVHAAVDQELPVTWVVLNNHGHGMVYQGDHLMRGRDLGASRFRTPIDHAGLARALGATAFEVRSVAELEPALAAAMRCTGPSLVDIHVDLSEVPPTLKKRVESLAAYIGKPADFQMRKEPNSETRPT